jgi:hypothetical protein
MFQLILQMIMLCLVLQHLRHNKHKVVLFHVVDTKTELKFDFDNTCLSMWRPAKPFRFSDNVGGIWKTGRFVFQKLALSCAQNKIKYVPVNVSDDFEKFYWHT